MIQKLKQNKKHVIGVASLVLATFLFIVLAVYAESNVVVKFVEDSTNNTQYLQFELNHNVTTAKYKYYGYGYTVTIYSPAPENKVIGYKYMDNSEFNANSTLVNGVETVKIYLKDLFDKLDVAEEYYNRVGCTVRLNGRLGIKVDGVLTHLYDTYKGEPDKGLLEVEHGTTNKYEGQTVPLNKDDQGILNGLPHEYGGIQWTTATQKNLDQHFGIEHTFTKAAIPQDQYKVNYIEIGKETRVAPEKKQEIIEGTKIEYPVGANGYIYAGKYKIDKVSTTGTPTPGTVTEGQSATVTQKNNADIYTITFYYDKIDYGTGGNPDAKIVNVEIYYKENSKVGRDLAPKETVVTKMFENLNIYSKKIDSGSDNFEWRNIRIEIEGQGQESFEGSSLSVVVGKYDYSTPKNDTLTVYCISEKHELPKTPKCEPEAYGESEPINLTMKKKDFDNATEFNVTGTFKLDEFRYGKDKDGNPVEGTHGFKCFDLYVKPGNGDKTSFDNKSKTISLNFNVPKSNFTKQTEEKYRANVDALYVGLCKCNNIGIDDNGIQVNITLEINKPPKAYYEYYTKVRQENGHIRNIRKAYVGKATTIENQATDPNGLRDIKYIKYLFIDPKGKQYCAKLYTLADGTYILESNDIDASNIKFAGADEEGNIDVVFKTTEQWTVKQYVEDQDGLNDIYSGTIQSEILDLKPTAKLADNVKYRYPFGQEFNGKQNRVVAYNSTESYVADYLDSTGVEINHNRDCWQIIPLNGQNVNSVKFESNIKTYIDGNILEVKYEPLQNSLKMMFKEVGQYKIRLQVTDTSGNVSDWTEKIITINSDIEPTIKGTLDAKFYRNTSKKATVKFNIQAISNDGDIAEIISVKYKFDSNNNGSFIDEILQTTGLTIKDTIINGLQYKEISLITDKVGKYQFEIQVKEKFGQETIEKYVAEEDYRTNNAIKQTEVDNMAPIASLGLSTYNNIDVKILASGLTGTKRADIDNNIEKLMNTLEGQYNIKPNIEIIDVGKEVDGTQTENSLTYRKVLMGGPIGNYMTQFQYIQHNEVIHDQEKKYIDCCIEKLPAGVYATGWNGYDIPDTFFWGSDDTYFNNKHSDYVSNKDGWWMIRDDFFTMKYDNNSIEMGGNCRNVFASLDCYSIVSNEKINDFAVDVNLYSSNRINFGYHDPYCLVTYFLFNVKDAYNYCAFYGYNAKKPGMSEDDWEEKYEDYPAAFIQVKNGRVIKQEKYRYVSTVRQQGNKIYLNNSTVPVVIDEKSVGGYIGLSAKEKEGLDLNLANITFREFKYTQNSSMISLLENIKWRAGTDHYIINVMEDAKLNEFTNTTMLNTAAAKLQANDVDLINVGISSINKTKLNELLSKNRNKGTYIELTDIASNFTTAAVYIRNKYKATMPAEKKYLLLNESLGYTENYSDSENDPLYEKGYKYVHVPTYFENGQGVIEDNNIWRDAPIEMLKKTGKYTLKFKAKDNPLKDNEQTNPFSNYRKFSNEFEQEIYVHRKPVASFAIDRSFINNVLIRKTSTENFDDNEFVIEPKYKPTTSTYKRATIYEGDLWFEPDTKDGKDNPGKTAHAYFTIDIPEDAINPMLTVKYKQTGGIYIYITGKDYVRLPEYNKDSAYTIDIPKGNLTMLFEVYPRDNYEYGVLKELTVSYYIPNYNVQVPVNDNSYDIDHKSMSNKGITEWEWRIVDKKGVTTTYNTTNRADGLTWIRNALSTNQKWHDATILLRVKDLEGVWSNWTDKFISETDMLDPGGDKTDNTKYKPLADFEIEKDPDILYVDTQHIIDSSSDPEGLKLAYAWKVTKDRRTLFTSSVQNIDKKINEAIAKEETGRYYVSLQVTNTKNISSDTVIKAFDVIVRNETPTVDFNLKSAENPAWTFPRTSGINTYKYRPTNTIFVDEKAGFNPKVTDPNPDNMGFTYSWKLERFAVENISNISGSPSNTYTYSKLNPFTGSFKTYSRPWGAYRITFSATDKPPIPPYETGSQKTDTITKTYYVVPEISCAGSYSSTNTEVITGDTITVKAKTSKYVNSVTCELEGKKVTLTKKSEDTNYMYWEATLTVPETIESDGTYYLKFMADTKYGGSGNITREVRDNTPIKITALKLINFRITDIVNHPDVTFPYTKDMLKANLIPYKTGYYVTFRIDSKGKPENVYAHVDIKNDGVIDQNLTLTKVISGGTTETWEGKFYTSARLPVDTIISIKLDCKKGSTTYNYNTKENWDGRSLIIKGSALQDGRINLTH